MEIVKEAYRQRGPDRITESKNPMKESLCAYVYGDLSMCAFPKKARTNG